MATSLSIFNFKSIVNEETIEKFFVYSCGFVYS